MKYKRTQFNSKQVPAQERLDVSTPCVVICPGLHGHGVARSLGRLGIRVYGVHADPDSPSAGSRYWRENYFWDLSKASTSESLDWFLGLARKIGSRPILIPTDDQSCLFVDDNADALLQEYLFPKQPAGLTRSLSNKKQLYSLCKKKSILTVETVFPQSRDDVREFIKNCEFPIMLKGIDTVALQERVGVRMVIVNDGETLLKRYDEMEMPGAPNLMLQEYIPGGAENVWMFDGYFDSESGCRFGITARKLRQYPAYTGMTSLGICETNETLSTLVKDFMKAVGYRGILDIGYKYNPRNGKYYLLDPNPRLGCSFRLFVDSIGMDVVRVLYRDLTGQPIITGELREGRKWLSEPYDLTSSIRYWRDGSLKLVNWIRSFQGVEEAQWFARDDMRPFWKVLHYAIKLHPGRSFAKVVLGRNVAMKKTVAPHPQREKVNKYFQEESSYWKDVYTIGGVQAENIRDRHAAVLEWIDDIALAPGSRVLEVGCGSGLMATALASRGFRVHAVDSVKAMVELARDRAIKYGTADMLSLSVGDVYSLAFDDSFFDLVLAIGVIPWLDQPEAAMQEMARVTKPGGHVILTTSNLAGMINLFDPFICPLLKPFKVTVKDALARLDLRRRTPDKNFHSNRYIDRVLGGIGLVKVKGMTRGFGFSFFHRSVFPEPLGTEVNRKLQRLADRNIPGLRSIGRAYIVLARKPAPLA